MKFALRHAARHAEKIITISHRSQNDLARVLGIPPSAIAVVYSGYDATRFNTEAVDPTQQERLRKKFGLGRPYLFHHGFIQPRKNLQRLVQAFRAVTAQSGGPEIDLVLSGAWGWRSDELLAEARASESARGRVFLTGPLDDSDLAAMIKGASLVVIPSLYEGFCLPLVESMACGVPVITSNTSCLPEISGNVLSYFDPESVEEITAAIQTTLSDSALRQGLVQRGLARAHEFTWRRSAEQTLEVLRQAAER
jgi:glycosyltransferase involved in cell wall biosynthesis